MSVPFSLAGIVFGSASVNAGVCPSAVAPFAADGEEATPAPCWTASDGCKTVGAVEFLSEEPAGANTPAPQSTSARAKGTTIAPMAITLLPRPPVAFDCLAASRRYPTSLSATAATASTNARQLGQRSLGSLSSARATAGRSALGIMVRSGGW